MVTSDADPGIRPTVCAFVADAVSWEAIPEDDLTTPSLAHWLSDVARSASPCRTVRGRTVLRRTGGLPPVCGCLGTLVAVVSRSCSREGPCGCTPEPPAVFAILSRQMAATSAWLTLAAVGAGGAVSLSTTLVVEWLKERRAREREAREREHAVQTRWDPDVARIAAEFVATTRWVIRYAYAVRSISDTPHTVDAERKVAYDRVIAAVQDFQRAVRRQLKVPNADELLDESQFD